MSCNLYVQFRICFKFDYYYHDSRVSLQCQLNCKKLPTIHSYGTIKVPYDVFVRKLSVRTRSRTVGYFCKYFGTAKVE